MKLLEQLEQSILSRHLLKRGQKVLIAVSGGMDSMALLDALHELSPRHGWRLTIAHMNHQLRGRSSDADEQFVIRTARKLGLPLVSERVACKETARVHGLSVEMAARKVRHEFLARAAARLRIRTIALAHHADDQVELFFMRLLRGSGNEGLAGMRWRNPSPADPKIELIRPLLDQSKDMLRGHVLEKKIRFREDATNASMDFQRNLVRHELLPLLRRKYQPALRRTILRVMEISSSEAELVGELAARWLKAKRREPLRHFPVAFQRRCIQLQLRNRGIPVDFELVEQLRQHPGHLIKVSPELAVKAGAGGGLEFLKSREPAGPNLSECEVDLAAGAGEITFGSVQFCWRLISGKRHGRSGLSAGIEVFDADKVGTRIVLRHWQTGDRFQPSGMPGRAKLQDLFTNNKIPREQRHGLVVATTQDGSLFWVERLRISEGFKLSDATIRCLQWRWKRL